MGKDQTNSQLSTGEIQVNNLTPCKWQSLEELLVDEMTALDTTRAANETENKKNIWQQGCRGGKLIDR